MPTTPSKAKAQASQMALKSRAEVQLVQTLNQNKPKSVSGYLRVEQKRVQQADQDHDQSQGQTQQPTRTAPSNLFQFRISASNPNNPLPPSEQDELIAAVRQLQDLVVVPTRAAPQEDEEQDGNQTPNQIELNAIRRRELHMTAQRAYSDQVKVISEQIEMAIISSADAIKDILASVDGSLATKAKELLDDSLLLGCEDTQIMEMWTKIEEICSQRTRVISSFGEKLDEIEATRIERVRWQLTQLTKTLMETAHALPNEVERIIEAEAYEVNVVVISNRKMYADLMAKMAMQDVDVLVQSRLQWEQGLVKWRQLRHDKALLNFHTMINSTLFTDPVERQQILSEMVATQQATHETKRLAALRKLQDAGDQHTSQQVQEVLVRLNEMQRQEEDTIAGFFQRLRDLRDQKIQNAEQLREILRLELHGFGALAQEGDIGSCKQKMGELLCDETLDDFFRMAGGLRSELDTICGKLVVSELIYTQPNLSPLLQSVQVLLSALPLEKVMESQGKSAERKAIQMTLDKMRKAAKHELVGLLPALQSHVTLLANLSEMSELFKQEVEEVATQLRQIVQQYEATRPGTTSTTAAGSPPGGEEDSVSERTSDGSVSPGRAPSTASGSSPRSRSTTGGTTSTPSFLSLTLGGDSSAQVDLVAIRKVQRRLGTLVYATELSAEIQDHLHYIVEQLELQATANGVLDIVITSQCEPLLAARDEESKLFLAEIAHKIDAQSAVLHDQCERMAKFFLQVVQTLENSEDRVKFVNLSVMDLLDSLQENDDEINLEMETQYKQTCARLRHAADSGSLQFEFDAATAKLHEMEKWYRLYQRRVALAAQNHIIATDKQNDLFLLKLCLLFGLVAPPATAVATASTEVDAPVGAAFDLEQFLSVQWIDNATLPKVTGLDDDGHPMAEDHGQHQQQPTGESSEQHASHAPAHGPDATAAAKDRDKHPHAAPKKGKRAMVDSHDSSAPPAKARFHSASGLSLEIELNIDELVHRILTQRVADEGDEGTVVEASEGESEPTAAAPSSPPHVDPVTVEEDATAEELAERQAHAARLERVAHQVTRDFAVFEVASSIKETLLTSLREVTFSTFDTRFKAHTASAAETKAQRHQACNLLLEERLRMHWPRKGRLDVQIYQPRIGELFSHRQRYDRHTRSMAKKMATQQETFEKHVKELQESMDAVAVKQLTLQAQLPMQQSLAALQGLEVKSKKLLSAFKSESDDKLLRLATMTTSDQSLLTSLTQDYIRMCSAQVFPDLSSCDVVNGGGCDYHPQEVLIVETKMQAIKAQLRETLLARDAPVVALGEAQRGLLATAKVFKSRYQSCLQNLSMKEGLGQKYGLPRRTAQERYRSETTRADELSASIDELLASLQCIVETKQMLQAKLRLPMDDVATQILHLLLHLRAQMYFRGVYFGLLKNVSQLQPLPVSYDAGGVAGRPTCCDKDMVDEQYFVAPKVPFLEFVNQVAVKCQEDTKLLYQQEGKLEDLPASGVPVALEEYLSSQTEKARAYVVQQELHFREQVDFFEELLALSPEAALTDFVDRARSHLSLQTVDLQEQMQSQLAKWIEQKNRNTVDLRPDLCSPNNAAQLEALCTREATRSQETLSGLRGYRATLMETTSAASRDFEKELIAMCTAFTTILDTCVMTLDDLKPFSGQELPKIKRKSLKRLRKAARIQEHGDPREVKRSDEEIKKLVQMGEAPRFPRRAWMGIPSFGMHTVWERKRTQLLQEDEQMQASDINTMDPLLASLAITSSSSNALSSGDDGACTALLTHAHRCLVAGRDAVYTTYSEFTLRHLDTLFKQVQEWLRDEIKWAESWQLGIDKVRQQQTRSPAAVVATAPLPSSAASSAPGR